MTTRWRTTRRPAARARLLTSAILLSSVAAAGGCAGHSDATPGPPAAAAAAGGAPMPRAGTRPATRPIASRPTATTPAALRPITYLRKFVLRENDEMRVTIAADGTYKITRRGGGGPSSSKAGTLTPDQRAKLLAAFAGWDALDDVYPDPGGADELYRVTIGYGDKTVMASDAALGLPQTFRDAYKQLRELVSEAGMV